MQESVCSSKPAVQLHDGDRRDQLNLLGWTPPSDLKECHLRTGPTIHETRVQCMRLVGFRYVILLMEVCILLVGVSQSATGRVGLCRFRRHELRNSTSRWRPAINLCWKRNGYFAGHAMTCNGSSENRESRPGNVPVLSDSHASLAAIDRLGGRVVEGIVSHDGIRRVTEVWFVKDAIRDDDLKYLLGFPYLRELVLLSVGVTDEGCATLMRLPVKSLLLRGDCSDVGLARLAQIKQLRHLYFTGDVTDSGLTNLINLRKLQDLQLTSPRVTSAGIKHLSTLTELQSLKLSGTMVDDAVFAHMQGMIQLEEIVLTETRVSDSRIADLLQFPKLASLDLEGTLVTDRCIDTLVKMKRLHFVRLSRTNVSSDGVKRLQKALPDATIVAP